MPTCMSAAPRRTGRPGRSQARRPRSYVRIASWRRPCAIRMSARARAQPDRVGEVARPSRGSAMASAYKPVGRLEIPARPVGEAEEGGAAAAAEVVVLARRGRAPGGRGRWCRRRRRAAGPGRPGGWRSPAGSVRNASSSTTTIAAEPVAPPASRPRCPASARRPAGGLRRPRSRPVTRMDPAYPLLSTGLARMSSSGSASSHRRSVASCRSRRIAGIASSTRSAARAKSSPAIAWRMASDAFAVLLVPLARPPVQLRRRRSGRSSQQARLEHVGEQMVIAIPLAPVVERDEEQVPSIERLQHRLAAVLAGDGVAQRAAQPAEDRGLEQEGRGPSRAGAAGPPRPGSRRCSGRPRRSRR